MRLVYNVYDDENQIESKQFDNFPEALEYAKQGLITYICEEDLDCPECEERVVWTWDSTWDDEEAINNLDPNKEAIENYQETDEVFDNIFEDNITITISGSAEEIKDLASLVFNSAFDLDFDKPVEEIKVERQNDSNDFGYDYDPDIENFEVGDPESVENELDNEETEEIKVEVDGPEIPEDPTEAEEPEEKLEVGKPFKDPNSNTSEDPVVEEPEATELLTEGEKVYVPDYDQHPEVDSYIIVSDDSTGKYFKQNWEAEVLHKLDTEEDYSIAYDWYYYSLVTNNLEESEKYNTIEEAMSALERAADDYTSGTTRYERTSNNTFIVDWTGEIDDKSAWYSYTVKALRLRKAAYYELEESLKEETKLATNQKGDYLVAAESGKGYTVFSRDNVCLGGFDGDNDQKAIDRFNKGDFKESLVEEDKSNVLTTNKRGDYLVAPEEGKKAYTIYNNKNEKLRTVLSRKRDGSEASVQEVIKWFNTWSENSEGPKNVDVVKSLDDLTLVVGEYAWLSNQKSTVEQVAKITKLERDKDGKIVDCSFVYSEPKITRQINKETNSNNDSWFKNNSLKESIDLPAKRISEIEQELEQYGNIYFNLFSPIEERDGDNYRRATRVKIVKTESNYEIYFEWLDEFDDLLVTEPELVLSTFEELLKEIDGKYVTILDLTEAKKMTKDELLNKEGTTDVNLINAGRPEEERVELEEGRQPVYGKIVIYYYINGVENKLERYNIVPKDIRADVDKLIANGAERVYVSEIINGKNIALDKYTYDPEWTPGTPEYATRNNLDFALAESISQELNTVYKELSRVYGKDVNELLYGPDGFMTLNYPNGFVDFDGDIIYSDKYWSEFEKWLEDNNKLSESCESCGEELEDDLTDQEFAEQLKERLSKINK